MDSLDEEAKTSGEEFSTGLITDEVGFFESGRAVLRSHLGKRWGIPLLVVLAIVFWPLGFYWKSIQFDPALFVTEWLKLSVEGVLLFLILEIVRHRSTTFVLRETNRNLLMVTYLKPSSSMLTALQAAQDYLRKNDVANASSLIHTAWRAWKTVDQALSDKSIGAVHDESMRNGLLNFRLALKPVRCESLLKSLRAAHKIKEFNQSELQELIDRSENLVSDLNTLQKSAITRRITH